ncbi:sulfurtransferase [Robertmurraya kyonggiensis]|uniref:Sulfurtransferase n=1 Tax=Robertmurraya kyonggiensis TaxID=1037680 RepID=A0A4U1DE19_9BACI|nr:sulfurtransferase [Robertmurraya kyonggiensis]TKC19646.1 sulfurtransferase [Robertmurraya kyonggiensis]
MKTIISKDKLYAHLNDESLRIVDCRFQLGNPQFGESQYIESHIPGAVYFDLEKDLSDEVTKHGGRHPLPKIEDFQRKLEEVGISTQTKVVAYDGGEGSFAARLWWLLKYVGHEEVYILDGGIKEWQASALPVSTEVPTYSQSEYRIELQDDMLATVENVRQAVKDRTVTLIDSRASNRYLGVEEPIDKIGGHIPTAINKDWVEGFQDGHFKTPSEQAERFQEFSKDEPIIVYCGSGVTATPNYIALKEAGYTNIKLYAGSYSDWISYDEHEVEIGRN